MLMRRLIRVFIFIAIAWSAYWFIAGYGLRNAITSWFDAQQARGWQAEFSMNPPGRLISPASIPRQRRRAVS